MAHESHSQTGSSCDRLHTLRPWRRRGWTDSARAARTPNAPRMSVQLATRNQPDASAMLGTGAEEFASQPYAGSASDRQTPRAVRIGSELNYTGTLQPAFELSDTYEDAATCPHVPDMRQDVLVERVAAQAQHLGCLCRWYGELVLSGDQRFRSAASSWRTRSRSGLACVRRPVQVERVGTRLKFVPARRSTADARALSWYCRRI
jgi:hypothetical protein